jgi:hypothetical protein
MKTSLLSHEEIAVYVIFLLIICLLYLFPLRFLWWRSTRIISKLMNLQNVFAGCVTLTYRELEFESRIEAFIII